MTPLKTPPAPARLRRVGSASRLTRGAAGPGLEAAAFERAAG